MLSFLFNSYDSQRQPTQNTHYSTNITAVILWFKQLKQTWKWFF